MDEERFEQFATLITGLYRSIQKLKKHHTQALGLKSVHIFWLYLLREHPQGMYASELAIASRSTRALVSREIHALTRDGLLTTREQTGRRRYGWRFVLTERGLSLANTIAAMAADIQRQVDCGIAPEDFAVFYRTLQALQKNFDQLTDGLSTEEKELQS